jgi:hypothetical protein
MRVVLDRSADPSSRVQVLREWQRLRYESQQIRFSNPVLNTCRSTSTGLSTKLYLLGNSASRMRMTFLQLSLAYGSASFVAERLN